MPYTIRQNEDDQYCVHREFEDDTIGDSLGCHDTRQGAINQIAAIESNEAKMNKVTIIRNEDKTIKSAHACGESCKALGERRVGGYAVVFTDKDDLDLHGEFFDKNTNFYLKSHSPIGKPLMLEHGFDEMWKAIPIGVIDFFKEDEIGIWIESKLHDSEEYEKILAEQNRKGAIQATEETRLKASRNMVKAIDRVVAKDILNYSGGGFPQFVTVNEETRHIDDWPFIEVSATVSPAEPDGTEINILKGVFEQLNTTLNRIQPVQAQRDGTGHESAQTDIVETGESDTQIVKTEDDIQTKEIKMNAKNLEQVVATIAAAATEALTVYMEELGITPDDVQEASRAAVDEDDELKAEHDDEDEDELDVDKATVELDAEKAVQLADRVYAILENKAAEKAQVQNAAKAAIEAKMLARQKAQPANQPPPPAFTQGNHRVSVGENLKYAHLSPSDMACGVLMSSAPAKSAGIPINPNDLFPEEYYKTMAHKMAAHTDSQPYTKNLLSPLHREGATKAQFHLKQVMPYKADELNASVITAQGLEWIGEWWSTDLWEKERFARQYDKMIAKGMMVEIIPQGADTAHFPIEGADPVAFVSPEGRSVDSTGRPEVTANISPIGTGRVNLTPKEIKIATSVTTILGEDSVINSVQQVNRQLHEAMMETRDKLMVNGDTQTGTTNINSDGTAPATGLQTPYYIASDGFLKVGLANGRDATNLLDIAQYRLTIEQLDGELTQFLDRLMFFVDVQTARASLAIPELSTRDVAGQFATIQSGVITNIYGIDVAINGFVLQADADGKVTGAGNVVDRGRIQLTYAPFFGVGYRRQITLETARDIFSSTDTYILSMRLGFIERGTNAAAQTFNVATAAS